MPVPCLFSTVALLVCSQLHVLVWAQSYGHSWNSSAGCVSNLGGRDPSITHDVMHRSSDILKQGSANAFRRNLGAKSHTLAALFTFQKPTGRSLTGRSKRPQSSPVAV